MSGSAVLNPGDELYHVAILIDELKHSDVAFRLNSMRKLSVIAAALGPERTRSELVPFVADGVDDDDQVLLIMAEQLGGLINAVGGPEYASVLLDPLTTLACVEEATVREKAVIALNGLLVALPDTIIERVAWPAIRALATRDWFTSRSAASALLARVMTRLPTKALAVPGAATKDDAFAAFVRLCAADEVAVVRRAAAAQIPDIATALAGGTLPSPESRANASAAAAAAALVGSNSVGAVELDLAEDVSSALPPAAPTPTIVDASSAAAGAAAAVILLPLAQAFARDEQDSVRLLGVLGAIAIARLANGGMASVTDGSAGARARLADGGAARSAALALLGELSRDRAWRIRWSVAHRLRELAEAIGAPLASSAIVPVLTALCRDSEAEVRAAAAYRIAEVATVVGPAATRSALLPAAEELVGDSSEPVRAALAAVLLGVVPVLGAGVAVDSVLPLFLRLLKDTAPHIRLHALARIDVLASAVPLRSLAPSLLPAVEDLSSARSWRLRAATINFMPALARLLGAEVFETTPTLVDLVLRWLADPVFAIREAAAVNLRALALAFGAPWAERVLMPRVLGLVDAAAAGSASGAASAFQMRMTSLLALITLSDALPPASPSSRLLAALVGYCKDPVPNVRFNAAKAIARLAAAGKFEAAAVVAAVRPVITTLVTDRDRDVRFFAQKAITALAVVR